MKIKGTTVLITGSATRLGKHMAMHLAAKGSDTIIIHYNKSQVDAYKLKENLEKLGATSMVLHGDLSTMEGIKSFLSECNKACRTIDILVNSASDFITAPLLNDDVSNYMSSIVVNGLAPHALIVWAYKNAGLKKSVNILPPAGTSTNYSRVQSIPLKRRGTISELNMALDFLIENDYITGQIIYVDGGAHLMSDGIDR